MVKSARSMGLSPLGEPFEGFSDEDWQQIYNLLGDVKVAFCEECFENDINYWLQLNQVGTIRYPQDQQNAIKGFEKAAAKMAESLRRMQFDVRQMAVGDLSNSYGISPENFQSILDGMTQVSRNIVDENEQDEDPYLLLIGILINAYEKATGLRTTVATPTPTSQNVSPFVEFVALVGRLEPRLKKSHAGNELENTARWLKSRMNDSRNRYTTIYKGYILMRVQKDKLT